MHHKDYFWGLTTNGHEYLMHVKKFVLISEIRG